MLTKTHANIIIFHPQPVLFFLYNNCKLSRPFSISAYSGKYR
jgi:hypothetical protein